MLTDFPEFEISPAHPIYFTGEMIYPWMFTEIGALRPLYRKQPRTWQRGTIGHPCMIGKFCSKIGCLSPPRCITTICMLNASYRSKRLHWSMESNCGSLAPPRVLVSPASMTKASCLELDVMRRLQISLANCHYRQRTIRKSASSPRVTAAVTSIDAIANGSADGLIGSTIATGSMEIDLDQVGIDLTEFVNCCSGFVASPSPSVFLVSIETPQPAMATTTEMAM